MPRTAQLVAIEVLTDLSCEDWFAAKGRYECAPKRAQMLIRRGYARACQSA
jgi:hypothetical protein